MTELSKTYLLKNIPFSLEVYPHKELIDHYVSFESSYPKARLRKYGSLYEITKKVTVQQEGLCFQTESIIDLSKAEYQALAELPNKTIQKTRYYVPWEWLTIEIDVFQRDLDWLLLMNVEFPDKQIMKKFTIPEFCLADVTENSLFVSDILCDKTYTSLSSLIKQYSGKI